MRFRALLAACVSLVLASCSADVAESPETMEPMDAQPTTVTADPVPHDEIPAAPAPPPTGPADEPVTTIIVADSEFGDMLYADNGQAIYLFDIESAGNPLCYDACASDWPPVLTPGPPLAGDGTSDALLGTVERNDGATQVTYNGWPLYFYAGEGPWEVKCHNVSGYGGLWLVVTPDGEAAAH